jgi:hypothetical protein
VASAPRENANNTADNQTTEAKFPVFLLPALHSLVARATENAAESEEFSFASEEETTTSALVRDGLRKVGFDVELGRVVS